MYEVKFSTCAEKQFLSLDRKMQERIVSVLKRIRIRPFSFVKRLSGNPYYRLRVGDYRLIVDIKQKELAILVIEIGHRKNVYDI